MNICKAVITAAVKQCLSVGGGATRQPVRKVMSGWNEYVKPFQNQSRFWFGFWKAADCPTPCLGRIIQYTEKYKDAMQIRSAQTQAYF